MRERRGMPTLYRPSNVFFWTGMLLCLAFGLTLAGIHAAVVAEDWYWALLFILGEICCVVLYFWNVWSWLRYNGQSDDYICAYEVVGSWDDSDADLDFHPGEHQ